MQGIPRYLTELLERSYFSFQQANYAADMNLRQGHTLYYEPNGATWTVASAVPEVDENTDVYIDPEEADPRRIAHHISVSAVGPASYPANWTQPEPQLTNAPWIALAQMGSAHIIPFSPYHVPAKTTMVAASTSQMQRNLEEGLNPDDVLEGAYSGVYEHGNVSIQWRDDWPVELTDETKKNWISRYLVMKKVIVQVGDGEPQETTTIKPLSDYEGETFSEKTLLENVDAGAPEIGKTKKVVLSLMPVEVVTPQEGATSEGYSGDLVTATNLKVAKMELSLDENHKLKLDKDPDRFFVRIPGGARLGGGLLRSRRRTRTATTMITQPVYGLLLMATISGLVLLY